MMRSITMYVTVLPVASKTYFCSSKANNTSPLLVTKRVLQLISGFGLSINGKHTYCGDYIYSGHTVVLVLSYLIDPIFSCSQPSPSQRTLLLMVQHCKLYLNVNSFSRFNTLKVLISRFACQLKIACSAAINARTITQNYSFGKGTISHNSGNIVTWFFSAHFVQSLLQSPSSLTSL